MTHTKEIHLKHVLIKVGIPDGCSVVKSRRQQDWGKEEAFISKCFKLKPAHSIIM